MDYQMDKTYLGRGGERTDLVFQSKKIARRRKTNVMAIAERADGTRGNRKKRASEHECGHAEQRSNDIELPGLEHERLFAHEDIADQAATHGIYHAHENAGGNGQACLKGFAGTHDPVGSCAKRVKNQEWLG